MSYKILYIEDEETLGLIVSESLKSRGFEIDFAKDGTTAINMLNKQRPDICLIDIMLPDYDGFDLAKIIHSKYENLPFIFLTAKSQTQDVIKGFNLGAYDYIKKPYSIEELIVRINSILDRIASDEPTKAVKSSYIIGKITFNHHKQELLFNEVVKQLTHRESELLKLLYDHRNDILDRKQALLKLWGDDDFFNARSMDVFISKLRKYLSLDPRIKIVNVRGYGYRLIIPNETNY